MTKSPSLAQAGTPASDIESHDAAERLGNLRASVRTTCLRLAEADAFFTTGEFEDLLDHIRAFEDAVAAKLKTEGACSAR